jgi:hypothetical protein
MITHTIIAALRSDDTPQRHAQLAFKGALDHWHSQDDVVAIKGEIQRLSQGEAMESCPALRALFDPDNAGQTAQAFAHGFVDLHLATLRAEPMGHLALRHFTDGRISNILLAQVGGVSMSLVVHDAAAHARSKPPASVSFTPADMWEIVLAGEAVAERVRLQPHEGGSARQVDLAKRQIALETGDVWQRDGSQEMQFFHNISGRIVRLTLQRRQQADRPVREYELASGKLIHQAAAEPKDSRHQIMLSLLGRMGRVDAAPVLADIASGAGDTALRWEALREVLGMDTAMGFAALSRVARDMGDPLAASALALRGQLLATYPQLRVLENQEAELCPA